MPEILYSTIKDANFVFPMNAERRRWMEAHEGERFVHEVSEDKPKRTLSQNALMWKYWTIVEQATGQPADDLHEIAKRKFLKPRQIKIFDEDYRLPASSTKLTKSEFSDYLDRCAAWTGIEVPDTEEYNRARGKIKYPEAECLEVKF